MNWQLLLDPALCERVCLALVHSLWQVGLTTAMAWGAVRWWTGRSARASYAVYVAAMIAGLAAVPGTFLVLDWAAPTRAVVIESGESVRSESLTTSLDRGAVVAPPPSEQGPIPVQQRTAIGEVANASVGESSPSSRRWPGVVPWIAAAYAVGVVLMLGRLGLSVWNTHRLGARATRIDDGPIFDLLQFTARSWSMRVVPALARAERIAVPTVVGLLRPIILLPAAAMNGLSSAELQMILAHELAHVRRHDMWVNLLQRLAESVLFFNLALWYLSRRISALRELCCDDLACRGVREGKAESRVHYARALVRIAELSGASIRGRRRCPRHVQADLSSLAASGQSPSELRRRVAYLFGEPLYEPLRITPSGILSLLIIALALVCGPATLRSQPGEAERGLDLFGEPLPEGAIARLGTTRFRHPSNVSAVAVSPDGNLVASSSHFGDVRMWETATGKLLHIFQPEKGHPVDAIAFSPDSSFLAVGGRVVFGPRQSAGAWWLWDVESGETARQVHFGAFGEDRTTSIALSPDGQMLATGHDGGAVRLWNVSDGKLLLTLPARNPERGIRHALCFSPDGMSLASAPRRQRPGAIEIWRLDEDQGRLTLQTGENPLRLDAGQQLEVDSFAFTREGNELIVSYTFVERKVTAKGKQYLSTRSKVLVWNPRTGEEPDELAPEGIDLGPSIAMSQDGKLLVAASRGGAVVWDFPAGRVLRTLSVPENPFLQPAENLAISSNGRRVVATSSRAKTAVFVWDTQTGALLPGSFESHSTRLSTAGFFAGGTNVATLDGTGFVRTWDAATGRPLHTLQPTHMVDRGGAVAHGGVVIKAPTDSLEESWLVELWEAGTAERIGQYPVPAEVVCTAITPDRRLAAAAYGNPGYGAVPGAKSGIAVWDAVSGGRLAERGTRQSAVALALDSDQPVVYYVTAEKSLISWNYETSEHTALMEQMRGVGSGLSVGMAFSQDLRTFVACDRGAVHVYDLVEKRERLTINVPKTIGSMLAISPDNRTLATAGVQVFSPTQEFDEAIYLWDLHTGEQIKRIGLPDAAVTAMSFSSDGQRLVTATAMGTALVWNVPLTR